MSLSKFFIVMSIATSVCWVAWVIVLFFIDPFASGGIGLFCFYASLFFGIFGMLAIFGFGFRVLVFRKVAPFHHMGVSLRQAFWFAALVIMALLLLANQLFNLASALFLLVGVTILEAMFLLHGPSPRRRSTKESS